MPDAIASLGTFFGGPGGIGNILKTFLGGSGIIGNFISQQQQQQALNQELKYQKNPSLAAAKISQLTQPLSSGLIQDVGNETQGYLAERGLAESPQQSQAILGQALAPYVQQNQNTATQEFFNLLNPAGAKFAPQTNLASIFSMFQKNPYGGYPGATPGTFPGSTGSTSWDPFSGTGAGTGGYGAGSPPPTYSDPSFGDLSGAYAS
jgi:hypothetical protein